MAQFVKSTTGMRTMIRAMLVGALVTAAGCTNDPQDARWVQAPAANVATEAQCDAFVKAARVDHSMADVDAAIRKASELRRTLPVPPGDADVRADEVARLHATVDVDMNRLAAARQALEDAKRTFEVDAIALDQAIYNYEHTFE